MFLNQRFGTMVIERVLLVLAVGVVVAGASAYLLRTAGIGSNDLASGVQDIQRLPLWGGDLPSENNPQPPPAENTPEPPDHIPVPTQTPVITQTPGGPSIPTPIPTTCIWLEDVKVCTNPDPCANGEC